jgi:NAD(P)-dependent dehydrogenase (short-subunit alcohol dehydrogenase family)
VGRAGSAEEIGKLVCFLASDDAAFINGGVYVIDGGSLAWRGSNA